MGSLADQFATDARAMHLQLHGTSGLSYSPVGAGAITVTAIVGPIDSKVIQGDDGQSLFQSRPITLSFRKGDSQILPGGMPSLSKARLG